MTTPALPHGTAKPSSYSASQKSIDNVRDANVKVGANYDEENRDLDSDDGSDHLPQGRQLGLVSAIFLIVNRIVGTGIFATTSTILDQSGSVGMSLIYWLIGAVIAMTGYLTFAELGSAMPKNGAELNYLQYMYRRPKYLVATMYAAQAFLLGGAAGNSYVAGRYLLSAGGVTSEWGSRGIGAGILITVLIVHGTLLKWGLRFQNIVGLLKLVVLVIIAFSGFAALAGHTKVQPPPSNFKNVFAGSRSDVYGTVSCLYNAVWSYVGFTNIFYAMSEIKRPIRTMKIAGPAAIVVITVLYMLVQVAYFAAVPREEILGSTQVIAALYFRNMFGHSSERALSVLVALSATANVFSVVFSNGRLVQAMGRDSLIPLPKLFASNRPFKAPLAGIAWHTLMTLIILLAPPAGDAYNFVLNLASYPINVAVDLWYWGTGDYEWYSPEAVNTTGGALVITLDEYEKNNKNFRSGMVQSWNKLCFQGGYIEIAAKLPGKHNSPGYWPGLWTQGNLGRPGYGATNEGMWPYSYSSCDTGILPNQTFLNKTGPAKAMDAHGEFSDQYNYELSWLPGMRFPSCTCAGEDHPGPNNNVGRSSPEIDILEANINLTSGHGQSSQSLQMAPFDIDYFYGNKTGVNVELYNLSKTRQNDYTGGTIQESISALSRVPDTAYQYSTPNQYSTFGIQWEPDWKGDGSNAYVTWFMDGEPTWTVYGNAIGAVPELDISQRLIPREPMVSRAWIAADALPPPL
ncbi:methionine permease [Thecaphora frezii]